MKIEIKGLESLRSLANDLRQVEQTAFNLRGIEREAAELIARQNSEQFSRQAGPTGKSWTPLSTRYALRKRKIAPSKGILELSGSMRASLENPSVSVSGDGGELTISYRGEHSELIGFHNRGAGNLPIREVGGLSSEAKEKLRELAFSRILTTFGQRLKRR